MKVKVPSDNYFKHLISHDHWPCEHFGSCSAYSAITCSEEPLVYKHPHTHTPTHPHPHTHIYIYIIVVSVFPSMSITRLIACQDSKNYINIISVKIFSCPFVNF